MFCYRVRKYIGAYTAALGRVDAVVFSGGIGAHQAAVRERCCSELGQLGIDLDPARNAGARDGAAIHADTSRVALFVIHTDEEREIAAQTAAALGL
jgi:acetate kinase